MLKSSTLSSTNSIQILKFGSEKQRILHTRKLYGTNMEWHVLPTTHCQDMAVEKQDSASGQSKQ